MPRSKKASHEATPPVNEDRIPIIVLCSKCDLWSQGFKAYVRDLADDRFVAKPSTYYGTCSCGREWIQGTVLRDPDSDATKIILLERDNKSLTAKLDKQKTQIESYEKAMSLMGGGMMPFFRGPFG